MRSDVELIQCFMKTQESAYFDVLYDRYSTKVYAKCLTLLRDETRAQDAVQDIFTKIFLNLSKFSERSKFSTWIYSITYNYCIDLIRRSKKDKNLFADEIENPPDLADDEIPDKELLEMEIDRLKAVLEGLPGSDRAVLLMKYQEELQIRDIALALGKTESAIKMKIKRAKERARAIYQNLYPPGT
ncbi:MAG: sigma-70 family RNA polymerase sigma factor [Saprospiraceae bacterium]|nr:sigma-70 family RNA polymerase sigma factor [Saprospiraceae bacterium]